MSIYDYRTVQTARVLPPKPDKPKTKPLTELQLASRWAEMAKAEKHRKGLPGREAFVGERTSAMTERGRQVMEAFRAVWATGRHATTEDAAKATGIPKDKLRGIVAALSQSGHIASTGMREGTQPRYRVTAWVQGKTEGEE